MNKYYLAYANHDNKWVKYNITEKQYCKEIATIIADGNNYIKASVENNNDYSGRPEEAKKLGCTHYIAIHTNAFEEEKKCTGCVCYYHPKSSESKKLAEKIVKTLDNLCDIKSNRSKSVLDGFSESNYPVVGLGEIREPYEVGLIPVLVEINFHSYTPTAKYMYNNKERIAEAIKYCLKTEEKSFNETILEMLNKIYECVK